MLKQILICLFLPLTALMAQYLTVSTHTPAKNASAVAVGSNIAITFNSAVNGATLNDDATFNVDGSQSGGHPGSFSGSGSSVIIFNPWDDFEYGETVTITLTTGIQSTGALALATAYTFQFVVEATAGSGYFYDSSNSLGSSPSNSVAMGDLDGDGDIDAVTANESQAQGVWLNSGSGSFSNGTSFGSGASKSIKLGDVDGDGDLDAVIANYGAAQEVWLNNNSGNFGTSAYNTFGGGNSNDVALGDVDGDGDLDAVVANFINEAQEVWLNNGSGDFGASAHDTFGSGLSKSIILGDVDGDGDLDAAVMNQGTANEIWLNDGSGNFGATAYDSFGSGSALSGAFGDLDGDGDLDVVVGNSGTNTVRLNDGSGDFGSASTFGSGTISQSVALGDVDGDGDLDAVTGNEGQAQQVWLNNGSGNFGASAVSSFDTGSTLSIGLADVDGDADLDVFSANISGQANTVWLNLVLEVDSHTPAKNALSQAVNVNISMTFNSTINGASLNDDATFNVIGSLSGRHQGSFSGGATATITFDPDISFEDGEVVTVTLTSGISATIGSLLNQPNAFQFTVNAAYGWGTYYDSGNSLGSSTSQDAALGDLDGDGDLDTFVANWGQANTVWLNNGSGTFTDNSQSLGSANSTEIFLGDLDGDGDLDAFVSNQNQANTVWLNNGSGSFSPSANSLGSSSSIGVCLGDVDGDGDLDAFIANYNQANKVWNNDGNGNFTDSGNSLGSSQSSDVSLGDLDGDGDLDAFVTNINQANTVWLNDGSGLFSASANSLGSWVSQGVVLGDVDGDGDLDAFVANEAQANKVWSNDGKGNFTDSGNNLGVSSSLGVSLGDMDDDGDLDAFVVNTSNQPNKVWLNQGGIQGGTAGTFLDSGNSMGISSSIDVSLGDVDDDGDLDAFVANTSNQPNKVWQNERFDFGDLPTDYNLTELADDGARHNISNIGIFLGSAIDAELDGQESSDAGLDASSGDDNTSGDEDGVTVIGTWHDGINGGSMEVTVTGGSGYLSAWIDWNDDNDFVDTGEQIFNMEAMTTGTNSLNFDIPTGAIPSDDTYNRFSRFRLDDSTSTVMTTTGTVTNGEVEDHYLQFTGLGLTVTSHTPIQNAIDVATNSSISVTFSANINAATLNDDVTFNVDGSQSGEHQGVFSGGGTATIVFDPTNNFKYGEVVTVTMTTGIKTTGDKALSEANTFQFTMEASQGWGSFDAQIPITTSTSWARDVYSADLDGDGDLDVLSASSSDDEIAWYKNTDGQGTFGAQQIITSLADGARSVYSADLDGDGDLDVLSASYDDDKIAWYKNIDGQGTFGAQQIITSLADGTQSVYAADLDGDGDLDVLSASSRDDKIAWYENSDGQGTFGVQQIIATLAGYPTSVYSADLDGDGDLDVLSACFSNSKVTWYENSDGQGTFGAQQIITSLADGAQSVYSADLDGDGDLDVLSASSMDNKIAWYENVTELRVQAKVFLEGPYDAANDNMTTSINSSIPLISPYTEDARMVGSIPSTITDWVLVQLRSTADGSTVASRSTFLRNDGHIVADDGTTEYISMDANPGDYYIVIRHRNHLAVMSDEVHTLATEGSTLYDFTSGLDKYYGGNAAVLESGVYGMWAGDPNCSGGVNATDYMTVKNENGNNGYYDEDCNLSGGVNATDYMVIKPNSGKTCNVQ